jgi:hypothetical protein
MTQLEELLDILSYKRVSGSAEEEYVIGKYIATLPGAVRDKFGNWTTRVGHGASVAYTSHTDTVHRAAGRQRVRLGRDGLIRRAKCNPDTCLGADDGAGMWLMRQMVLAKVPGLYIFHRDEETGCQGSQYLATFKPEILKGVKAMVSFDRRGKTSIITHQLGRRTASDAFAVTLARQLALNGLTGYKADDTGVYTDSNEYRLLVPECTNLSVGYERQHTPGETQDVPHLFALLECMKRIDWRAVKIARDPSEIDPLDRVCGYFDSFEAWLQEFVL